ncbi:unnamed protein product [marine sediment metagenome]|uniref:Uncharacterized protein n=1 Tax=marine sediment metagenome TaxID=412755 RepID=X0YIA0_9ZZZZ
MKIGKYEIAARQAIIFLAAILVIFTLYCLAWLPPSSSYIHRGLFLVVCILLVPLIYPPKSKIGKIFLIIFTMMVLVGTAYPMIFEDKLMGQDLMATGADIPFGIIFLIGFFVVLSHVANGIIHNGRVLKVASIPVFIGSAPAILAAVTLDKHTGGVIGAKVDI